jgi:predicted dithiol-disulfide oxidoreductase (DUF899 family)
MPLGGELATDYAFAEWDAAVGKVRQVRLSELFGPGKDSLVLYSFMFKPGDAGAALEVPCALCTSIIDGIDGAVPHITERINFAVVTKAPIEVFSAHARARGWRHARLLSSAGTSFNADYRTESGDDDQYAMVTAFRRRGSRMHHFWSSELWFIPPEPVQNPRAKIRATSISCGRCGPCSTGRRRVAERTGCRPSPTNRDAVSSQVSTPASVTCWSKIRIGANRRRREPEPRSRQRAAPCPRSGPHRPGPGCRRS